MEVAAANREQNLVELVDEDGRTTGSSTVDDAHRAPGRLHRAFSVLLVDPAGRLLLQRRSAAKTRFPLRWANACCGHPAPGQAVLAAAVDRLADELGVIGVALREVGRYVYRASDPATGRVEHEYDHVLLGQLAGAIPGAPDPDEVAELRWVTPVEFYASLGSDPDSYAPWVAGVTALALPPDPMLRQ
jgi:isopentenyl-diphosphate delta-isomerase